MGGSKMRSPPFVEHAGRAFLGLLLVAMTVAAPACRDAAHESSVADRFAALDRPHIVLLVVDTLRADGLEPYGQAASTSPELRRWAEHGVTFEHVLAQSSWTKVSMASLLTSLWPRTHGVGAPGDGLGDRARTLAEVLGEAGYATAAVQSNGWLEQSFGFQQGFDRYVFPRAEGSARELWASSIWPHGDRVIEEARRLVDGRDPERPFFLYLHFMDVHEYAAPPSHRNFGTDQRGLYLAAISWVDETLGRVREMLERRGLLDDTVLIVASDHGEAFGENGAHGHAFNVFSPVLRVPLIVKPPFDMPALRVAAQVRNIDIAPTVLDLAGVPIPDDFEGESLWPFMAGDEAGGDRPSFAALPAHIMRTSKLQAAVNDGSWTLVRDLAEARDGVEGAEANSEDASGEHLFDLEWDPAEDANLVEFEPEEALRMRALLDAHLAVPPRAGVNRENVRIDPAIAERLRAVGYLE
jgi:arylsulfatase A-like enzyme